MTQSAVVRLEKEQEEEEDRQGAGSRNVLDVEYETSRPRQVVAAAAVSAVTKTENRRGGYTQFAQRGGDWIANPSTDQRSCSGSVLG